MQRDVIRHRESVDQRPTGSSGKYEPDNRKDLIMRFLMLVCVDNPVVPPTEKHGAVEEWVNTMDARGARVTGDRLGPEFEATAVRVRGGRTLVTDGPFLETKEALAGFDLLECRDLAEAIEIASQHPAAEHLVMELRPIISG